MDTLRQVPGLLGRRVRIGKRYSVRLWLVLTCVVSAVVLLVKILVFSRIPNTITTVIDLEMDESLLTAEELARVPIPQRSISSDVDRVFAEGCLDIPPDAGEDNLNAALIVLSRNKELEGVVKSMKSLERHFNQWFQYPYIFLNDDEHSEEFKQTVRKYTNASVSFGTIERQQWEFPNGADGEFQEHIVNQGDRGIMYGQMESYHKMCRFYSRAFFKHELVRDLDWYWRVEPDVEFYCDLTYDPFKEMAAHGKKYGFTVMIRELVNTIPNLFRYTKTFVREHGLEYGDAWKLFIKDLDFYEGNNKDFYKGVQDVPDLIAGITNDVKIAQLLDSTTSDTDLDDDFLKTLVDKSGPEGLPRILKDQFDMEEYNLCHFWSNFEIARTDIFDNPLYDAYIDFLEKSGGFYKERWGDAPVHSLAVGLFLNVSDIHYFRDIGYKHSTLRHCPMNSPDHQLPYKAAHTAEGLYKPYTPDTPALNGVGCRCYCPELSKEIENSGSSCMGQWINVTKKKPSDAKLDIDKIREVIDLKLKEHIAKGGKAEDWELSAFELKELTKLKWSGP